MCPTLENTGDKFPQRCVVIFPTIAQVVLLLGTKDTIYVLHGSYSAGRVVVPLIHRSLCEPML